jgi:hypothetical protein
VTDEIIASVKRSLVPLSQADARQLMQASTAHSSVDVEAHRAARLDRGPGVELALAGSIAGVGYTIKAGGGSHPPISLDVAASLND